MAVNKTQVTVDDQTLADDIASYRYDPLGFVQYVFPWGEPGTLLEEYDGPDVWQAEELTKMGNALRDSDEPYQLSIRSGHGIGKGAFTAWVILFFMSTRESPQIPVTANTQTQLLTKTWRELAKWHKLAIHSHWFTWTATRFYFNEQPDTWYASAIPWSEQKPEAFAGTHEQDVLMVFDEASAIPDNIWESAEGAMTTPGSMWLTLGNPTQNSGRFHQCFNKFKHRWHGRTVDARTCKMTDKRKLQQWIDDWGIDSDFVRVRVLGLPPRAASNQLIACDVVEAAMGRKLEPSAYEYAARIVTADVARFGDDKTVLTVRQGLRVHEMRKYRELNTMQIVGKLVFLFDAYDADMIFVDVVGIGAGVVDRLNELGYPVIGVNAGSSANEDGYFNLRAEMCCKTRDWLKAGGSIPRDMELYEELTTLEYGYNVKEQIVVEKKEDFKERLGRSPDNFDSLNLSFAYPVAPHLPPPDEDDYDYGGEGYTVIETGVTGY